jgi:hypothetical protein
MYHKENLFFVQERANAIPAKVFNTGVDCNHDCFKTFRINERKQRRESDNKKLAYLLDLKTVSLEDLAFGYSLGQVSIDAKQEWLTPIF